jgi:hypothetical protein
MLANITSAAYDPITGRVIVNIPNSTMNGYQNQVEQYQSPNTLSVPVAGMLVDLDVQAATQMQITGYNNSIIDTFYTIAAGEFTSYSPNWYHSTRIAGGEIQQANSANIENWMMGQSTNAVLLDIMALEVAIINYLAGLVTYLETHVHSGVQGGSGNTAVPTTNPATVPSDSTVVSDQTYIGGNENLALTGIYTPHS